MPRLRKIPPQPVGALHTFSVSGVFPFPLRLLSTQRCWPTAPRDGKEIMITLQPPNYHGCTISLTGLDAFDPKQWADTGWRLAPQNSSD